MRSQNLQDAIDKLDAGERLVDHAIQLLRHERQLLVDRGEETTAKRLNRTIIHLSDSSDELNELVDGIRNIED